MAFLDWLTGNRIIQAQEHAATAGHDVQVANLTHQVETLSESLASLRVEDRGWTSITDTGDTIGRDRLLTIANQTRAASLTNPFMVRGKKVRVGYIWGQGYSVTATENEDGQDIDRVVQGYLNDDRNRHAVFGAQAMQAAEGDLFDDGNIFWAHFADPRTGHVQTRPLPMTEITEIVTAPHDRFTPHYYKRVWRERLQGSTQYVDREAYYPDIDYSPAKKLKTLDGVPVLWPGTVGGAAILHIKPNPVGRDRLWGIGDGAAALPYATAYQGFLQDWFSLVKALSRIAWQVTNKGGRSQATRAAAEALTSLTGVGGAVAGDTVQVEAVPKTDATIDADSGRSGAAAVAAALDLPVTVLLADPGVTGARAVAETLDRPMHNAMTIRREVWADALRASIRFMLRQQVAAPYGSLRGSIGRDGDRELLQFTDDTKVTLQVRFPDITEPDMDRVLDAIATADTLDVLPPIEKAKLVLHALRVENPEEIIGSMVSDDGEFVPPSLSTLGGVGQAMVDAYRAGRTQHTAPPPESEAG
ncbi:hypothetical protein [Pseudoglutamicibacter cumminsii]|uniref:hypothetical protein n=1 Tax=Pseudoglutamicibacter cumminsii TaxID=156979 RepID=UPI0021A66DCB|nr:hypothetical protein [Pseudoglutamicibacter cumminsii]MCT1686276.1 hypothetical protein [Pseudoglutamicibacter cumminsii]